METPPASPLTVEEREAAIRRERAQQIVKHPGYSPQERAAIVAPGGWNEVCNLSKHDPLCLALVSRALARLRVSSRSCVRSHPIVRTHSVCLCLPLSLSLSLSPCLSLTREHTHQRVAHAEKLSDLDESLEKQREKIACEPASDATYKWKSDVRAHASPQMLFPSQCVGNESRASLHVKRPRPVSVFPD